MDQGRQRLISEGLIEQGFVSRRLLRRIAPIWMLLVLLGSFLPGPNKKAIGIVASYEKVASTEIRWQHRTVHIFSFGSIGLLWALVSRRPAMAFVAFLGTIAFGLAIEYGQHWYNSAPLEWWDIRDDSAAAVGGVILGTTARVRRYLLADS